MVNIKEEASQVFNIPGVLIQTSQAYQDNSFLFGLLNDFGLFFVDFNGHCPVIISVGAFGEICRICCPHRGDLIVLG